MADPDERRIVRFGDLNVLGKAVFLTGAAIRTTALLIDKALEKTIEVIEDAERAYHEGRDPHVEDAKILQEWDEEQQKR